MPPVRDLHRESAVTVTGTKLVTPVSVLFDCATMPA